MIALSLQGSSLDNRFAFPHLAYMKLVSEKPLSSALVQAYTFCIEHILRYNLVDQITEHTKNRLLSATAWY